MKRIHCLMLTAILVITLCLAGCTDGSIPSGKEIDKAVLGTWYGPEGNPVLNIRDDATGTANFDGTVFDAEFSAANGKFSFVTTEETASCALCGDYIVEGDTMCVTATYEGTDYSVVFTRYTQEDLNISFVNQELNYEYILSLGGTCVGKSFPPTGEDTPETELYYVVKTPPKASASSSGNTSETDSKESAETIVEIYIKPPQEIYTNPESGVTGTGPDNTTETNTQNTTADKPEDKNDNTPFTVTIDENGKVSGNSGELKRTDGSIVGTWVSEEQEGTTSIFGSSGTFIGSNIFTFNADGTGQIVAMGIIPISMTYTYENNYLSMTISFMGAIDSGGGQTYMLGDTMYIDVDGEIATMTRTS
ncbi:MAG: hypothetical protein ACI4GZ_05435 [Ruminococcus sp.]